MAGTIAILFIMDGVVGTTLCILAFDTKPLWKSLPRQSHIEEPSVMASLLKESNDQPSCLLQVKFC